MILTVHKADGSIESHDVAEHTKLKACLKENVWFFNVLSGGQVAYHVDEVVELELGRVEFDLGRGNDDSERGDSERETRRA